MNKYIIKTIRGEIMKKKIFLLCAFLVLVTVGCKNDSNEPKEETPWVQQIYPLAGTKWQVSKVIHTKTGVEKPIFVGDDICTPFVPILDFATDTTGMIIIGENQQYSFNLSDNSWYKKYDAGMPYNIANFVLTATGIKEYWLGAEYNRYYGHIGYKLEGSELKFYHHDDGFFFFNQYGEKNMFVCYATLEYTKYVTDSNWYNCIIWEEIK